MFVSTYYDKLNSLWEELFEYKPLISWTCGSSCNGGTLHQQCRDTQKLQEFLMGLTLRLCVVAFLDHVLWSSSTLNRANGLVVKDERVPSASLAVEDKSAAVHGSAAHLASVIHGRRHRTPRMCSHCHKQDHDASRCWSLVPCSDCKKHGHDLMNCYEVVGYPEKW